MEDNIDGLIARMNSDICHLATISVLSPHGTDSANETIDKVLAIYNESSAIVEQLTEVKNAAKELVADVMAKTGESKYATANGKVSLTAPSISVTYDARAIDILLRDDADLAMRLAPYRKEAMRAGTMRITGNK